MKDMNHTPESASDRINRLLQLHDKEVSPWRIFKIMSEFVQGFEFVSHIGKSVTFFGSARIAVDDPLYAKATELAALLAADGFAVVTGGGPGIMEAANKGAYETESQSIGLNIKLPMEQRINRFVNQSEAFSYFFTRKVMLSFSSEAYIYFPGGFGTLDELFEIITLIQTKKLDRVPVVLVHRNYWDPLFSWLQQTVLSGHAAIDQTDLELLHIVDTPQEAYEYLTEQLS